MTAGGTSSVPAYLTRRTPSFLAEANATLLGIAAQARRRLAGRRQALAVIAWRHRTAAKGGAFGRPTIAQWMRARTLAAECGLTGQAWRP